MSDGKVKFRIKRCTAANRTTYTPLSGEALYETDTGKLYVGDGTTAGGNLITGTGTGEANTVSNIGTTGVGIYKQKVGVNFELKKVNAASNKVSITDDTANNKIDIGVNEANFTEVIKKADIAAKGDLIVGQDNSTPVILPVGSNYMFLNADSAETNGVKWCQIFGKMKPTIMQTNSTVDLLDHVLFVNTTAGDITVTLPSYMAYPNDGLLHELWIKHAGGSNRVIIQLQIGEYFFQGHNKVILNTIRDVYHCGALYGMGWSNVAGNDVVNISNRTTTWAASNFTAYTAIPWNNVSIQDNDSIMKVDTGGSNPSRLYCYVTGRYEFSYSASIDCTGGSTWNFNTRLRVNGTTTVPGSELRTGNYGSEDGSVSSPAIIFTLTAGDYVDFEVIQTNLTGNLVGATLTAITTI